MDTRHGTVGWDEVMLFETDEDVAAYQLLWSEIDRIAAAETGSHATHAAGRGVAGDGCGEFEGVCEVKLGFWL